MQKPCGRMSVCVQLPYLLCLLTLLCSAVIIGTTVMLTSHRVRRMNNFSQRDRSYGSTSPVLPKTCSSSAALACAAAAAAVSSCSFLLARQPISTVVPSARESPAIETVSTSAFFVSASNCSNEPIVVPKKIAAQSYGNRPSTVPSACCGSYAARTASVNRGRSCSCTLIIQPK